MKGLITEGRGLVMTFAGLIAASIVSAGCVSQHACPPAPSEEPGAAKTASGPSQTGLQPCSQQRPSGCPDPQPEERSSMDEQTADIKSDMVSNQEGDLAGTEVDREVERIDRSSIAGTSSEPVQLIDPMDPASSLNYHIHDMAVQLLENFNGELVPEYPIAVATFVDLNDLYRTSPFGRYVAEQLMGELQRAGFQVVELRRTDSILIKERYGEYGLSRQVREIARDSNAQYVLVGTYVNRGGYLFTNARLISSSNNMVASSALKILKRDRLIDRMLWPSSAPVRHKTIKVPIKQWGELSEVQVLSGS